jgi:hypothetical protein
MLNTCGVVDALADSIVGVLKLNKDKGSKNNFVVQNTK